MGASQDIAWAIAARALQGAGAALMMPTALAIVSAVYPDEEKGAALGILAGASAFFAALGPVLGGALTAIDWRLVFLINVPLAVIAILLTLRATPRAGARPPTPRATSTCPASSPSRSPSAPSSSASARGRGRLGRPADAGPDRRRPAPDPGLPARSSAAPPNPMIDFTLFRHENFLAANLSQFLAGMVELGLGFLTPFFLLLVVGVSPAAAGVALIPATIPIILAGPLAGQGVRPLRRPLAAGRRLPRPRRLRRRPRRLGLAANRRWR